MVETLLGSVVVEEDPREPLCIGFVNTVGNRRGEDPDEYLKSAQDLRDWMRRRGLIGESNPVDEEDRERALVLRDSMYRIFSAAAASSPISPDDIDTLNDELCEAFAKLELTRDLKLSLADAQGIDRALMLLSVSAAKLLTSGLVPRIRACANETCGWIFIDGSKNRSRRWCDMADCGNRAKARRFQQRRKAERSKTAG